MIGPTGTGGSLHFLVGERRRGYFFEAGGPGSACRNPPPSQGRGWSPGQRGAVGRGDARPSTSVLRTPEVMRAEEATTSRHPFRCHRPAPPQAGSYAGLRIASEAASQTPAQQSSPPRAAAAVARMLPPPRRPRPSLATTPGPVVPLPRSLPGPRLCSVSFPLPLSSFCSGPSGAPPLASSRESLSKCTPSPILLSLMVASHLCPSAQAETRLLLESPTPPPGLVLTPGRFFCLSNNSFLPNKNSDSYLLNTLPGPGGYILQPVFSFFEV